MTADSRKTFSDRLRLPFALGIAGLMVTGTTAMAWPALKTAFVPAIAPAVAPADPAAVSGFVETTRAQMAPVTPAVVDPLEIPAATLARTHLMLDASILRKPRMASDPLPLHQVQQSVPDAENMTSPRIVARTAQSQTIRPAPRRSLDLERSAASSDTTDQPVVAAPRATVQVAPVVRQRPTATSAPAPQNRLGNVWMLGAFR